MPRPINNGKAGSPPINDGKAGAGDWPRNLYRTPPTERSLEPLPVDLRIVEACAPIALRLGGPKLSRLGVTSALRGEGRTTIALAMAAVQAREFGRRTLLVDADFEAPGLSEAFGYDGQPGLAEITTGELSIDTAAPEVGDGVAFLPSGIATKRRSRMVRELLASDVLQELGSMFEAVIVDLPPLLGTTDGPLLAAHFENALLVVRSGVTPLARIEEAIGLLHTKPYVLVNGVNPSVPNWLSRLVDHS